MLFHSSEKIRVGIYYPALPTTALASTVSIATTTFNGAALLDWLVIAHELLLFRRSAAAGYANRLIFRHHFRTGNQVVGLHDGAVDRRRASDGCFGGEGVVDLLPDVAT